jgi:hypothetical protein
MRVAIVAAFMALFFAASSTAPARACAPLPGWKDVAAASAGKYLIFGELHGTREGPRAVAEFVCAVSPAPTLVAFELDSSANETFQHVWREPRDFPERLANALPDIVRGRLDGVGSQAMVDMLVSLHTLNQTGAAIDVVLFNGAKDEAQRRKFAHLPLQEPHEAAQAENIRNAAMARSYRHVVILVGSVHAQKASVATFGPAFEPMAVKLAPGDRVVSLLMQNSGGTAWNCIVPGNRRPMTRADLECGPHRAGGSKPAVASPAMTLDAGKSALFDGIYSVGPVSASPPAETPR